MKDRIKQVRKRSGLSQSDFGKKLGVGRDTISNYELGRADPPELFCNYLCTMFDINPHWLQTGEGSMEADLSEAAEVSMIFGEALSKDADPRRKKLLLALINMVNSIPDEALPAVCEYARQIADSLDNPE